MLFPCRAIIVIIIMNNDMVVSYLLHVLEKKKIYKNNEMNIQIIWKQNCQLVLHAFNKRTRSGLLN